MYGGDFYDKSFTSCKKQYTIKKYSNLRNDIRIGNDHHLTFSRSAWVLFWENGNGHLKSSLNLVYNCTGCRSTRTNITLISKYFPCLSSNIPKSINSLPLTSSPAKCKHLLAKWRETNKLTPRVGQNSLSTRTNIWNVREVRNRASSVLTFL